MLIRSRVNRQGHPPNLNPRLRELAYRKVKSLADCPSADTDLEKDIGRSTEQSTIGGRVAEDVIDRLKLAVTPEELVILTATVVRANVVERGSTDDTRVAQIKKSIAKVNKRLDIQRRELSLLQDTVTPSIALPTESVDDIMAPITGKPAAAAKPTIAKSGD